MISSVVKPNKRKVQESLFPNTYQLRMEILVWIPPYPLFNGSARGMDKARVSRLAYAGGGGVC
jgi:hypothetical protein